jgi:hypothetical protein
MPVQCTGILDIAMFTCGQFRLAQENTMIHDNRRAQCFLVDLARQKIPVARRTDEERRARPVRRRAWLRPAYGDEVWHRRYRGGREEDSFSRFLVIGAHPSSWSVTSDEKEAGTIGPARCPERIRKLFTNNRDLSGRDQVIAQRGSVPQARGHSASRPKGGFVGRSGLLFGRTAIFRFLLLAGRLPLGRLAVIQYEGSYPPGATLEASPTDTGTGDRKSTACQFARA